MKSIRRSSALILVFCVSAAWFQARGSDTNSGAEGGTGSGSADAAAGPGAQNPALPAMALAPLAIASTPAIGYASSGRAGNGVNWGELFRSSGRFLAVEHGFRLLTEPGTRQGLKGSFFHNYANAVSNLHGFADGDEFYVNYVGHPMQGAVAGFLWVQNDRSYRHAEFGADRVYWKSRLRACAFVWAYSTQFEIGPLSEASIGGIQGYFPQQGFVDHVITPSIGMAWMIGEDAIDRYIIKRIEDATTNRWARLLARSGLNPARTFANVLGGRAPWNSESRPGILSYQRMSDSRLAALRHSDPKPPPLESPKAGLAPPFEFAITFQPERFVGERPVSCLGAGANGAFRLAPSWQLVAELGGCNIMGLEKNLSGDSLTYAVGPRWVTHVRGPWSAHFQVLFGGNKITQERMFPQRKEALEAAAVRDGKQPPLHEEYTTQTDSNGFAVATAGGLNYQLNRALTVRVADLSYRHSWTTPLWGRDYSGSVKFTAGLVVHMGTW